MLKSECFLIDRHLLFQTMSDEDSFKKCSSVDDATIKIKELTDNLLTRWERCILLVFGNFNFTWQYVMLYRQLAKYFTGGKTIQKNKLMWNLKAVPFLKLRVHKHGEPM